MRSSIFLPAVFLTILMALPACELFDQDLVPDEPKKIDLRKKSAEIIEADQLFAFELFKQVYTLSDEVNMMISPLSVSYALGMTYNGAAGTTLEAFNEVLHFGDLTNQEVNESYKDLMNQLIHLDEQVEFSIANSIWYKLGYPVLDEFIITNQDYFDAAVEELDFSDPGAVDVINGWIEDKTNDKIRDMLDFIPSDAVMYLVNAIYFNAKWKYQFDPEDTYEGEFHLEDGSAFDADFMKINGSFNYTANEDFTAVELPYGDSTFSMVVMLPTGNNNLDDLVDRMDIDTWNTWFASPTTQNVQIELPKFTYDFKDLLNDPLINLGLGIAFGGGADFSRITPGGDLYISRVIHQTFIDVEEEGTEAAAATIVEIKEISAPVITMFKANSPFLFVIRENSTSAIMFMGKVGRPEYP
ncbi:MAG: serpin family protein [Bacteroidales bacterium]|nr:serpin family protein [Bacteroidales bacterium]